MSPEDNLYNRSNNDDCPSDPILKKYKKKRKEDGDQADDLRRSSNRAKSQDFLSKNDGSNP